MEKTVFYYKIGMSFLLMALWSSILPVILDDFIRYLMPFLLGTIGIGYTLAIIWTSWD